MYFANGGGPCYIVSVGANFPAKSAPNITTALESVRGLDEPTLLVLADVTASGHDALNVAALTQAGELQDRFAILDLPGTIGDFRNAMGTSYLSYGAAYHPKLKTSLVPYYTDGTVTIAYTGNAADTLTMEALLAADEALYRELKGKLDTALENQPLTLSPSGAVAGVYAKVDANRGVWKAPANISLNLVKGPSENITDKAQGGMNVDPTTGKSINAIRTFYGKGTLVWGARTLAGNDNEWRYVSVRRFYNMVEESVKKASGAFVFEPNSANTWVKVRAMIENFLTLQWRAGALAGAKAEDAFFVRVGLGQTMSAQDILEGRMIVEIGMAAVRPAEFIILRFSHMMQQS